MMMEITKIFKLYPDDFPEHIESIDLNGVTVKYKNSFEEIVEHRYVYDDVKEYYEERIFDIDPKIKTFGPIREEALLLDILVDEINEIFMTLDPDGYRETYKNSFLTPNW